MSVGPVAEGPPGNAAETNLIELVPLARARVARIHEMRRRRETRGAEELRLPLAQEAAQHVEDPAQCMGSAGERCRETRFQQRALGNDHLDQIVEPIVEQY